MSPEYEMYCQPGFRTRNYENVTTKTTYLKSSGGFVITYRFDGASGFADVSRNLENTEI